MAEPKEARKEVFLSYGHETGVNEFVTRLKSDLEEAGISVWRDTKDIPVGNNCVNSAADGVHDCRALLCVLTQKYVSKSETCKCELDFAKIKGKEIFPVLYEDINWEENANARGVDFYLTHTQHVDFRKGKVDYQEALRKLLEGMKEKAIPANSQMREATTSSEKDAILSQKVDDRDDHRILLRTHVSKAAGKGKAVLDALRLDADTIKTCFISNPLNEEEAVQDGLTAWVEGKGTQPPTWGTLLAAMETAVVGQKHILALKKDLDLS